MCRQEATGVAREESDGSMFADTAVRFSAASSTDAFFEQNISMEQSMEVADRKDDTPVFQNNKVNSPEACFIS